MSRDSVSAAAGLAKLKIEDYLDSEGNITLPEGVTLTSYLERNISELGETTSYRYLDYDRDGRAVELTWTQLGAKLRAVGARLQQVTHPGDRVAILAPQGVDYVVGFFAAIQAGTIRSDAAGRKAARGRRSFAAGHPSGRSGSHPRPAGRRLCRWFLRRHPGRHHRRPAIRAGVARARRAARSGAVRRPAIGRADDDSCGRVRR